MGRISPTNRNFVIAYVLLVGLPLLGLAGVLKAGYALTAPISVDGLWTLETDTAELCGHTLQHSVLTVSQSGKNLVVYFNHDPNGTDRGTATLAGASLQAMLPLPALGPNYCGRDASLEMKGVVDSKGEPKTMLGTISVKGCATCTAVSYRAVQQGRPNRKELH